MIKDFYTYNFDGARIYSALQFLNQDYQKPLRGREMTTFTLISSVFLAGFLSFYQPFGLHDYTLSHKWTIFTGFGLVSAFILFSSYQLVEVWLKKTNWKCWEVGISIIVKIILTGILTCIYAGIFNITTIDFHSLAWFTMVSAAVGIFPATGLLLFNFIKKLDRNNFTRSYGDNPYLIYSENGKEKISILPGNLLYIKSCDNYCEVVIDENGLKKKLIRNSLKAIQDKTKLPTLVKCHRSFLVNLVKVKEWHGNSQGLKLSFDEYQVKVPVSRSFTSKIKKKLMGTDVQTIKTKT